VQEYHLRKRERSWSSRFGDVRDYPLETREDCCEWHAGARAGSLTLNLGMGATPLAQPSTFLVVDWREAGTILRSMTMPGPVPDLRQSARRPRPAFAPGAWRAAHAVDDP